MVGITSCLNWHFLEYLAVLFPEVLPVVGNGQIEIVCLPLDSIIHFPPHRPRHYQ